MLNGLGDVVGGLLIIFNLAREKIIYQGMIKRGLQILLKDHIKKGESEILMYKRIS